MKELVLFQHNTFPGEKEEPVLNFGGDARRPIYLHSWWEKIGHNFFLGTNQEITLSQFKLIWYGVYGHRYWSAAMGACFFIPAAYFWARGMFPQGLKKRVITFGVLTTFLGLLSWNMVPSIAKDSLQGESDIPRVSQYKLAGHLSLALFAYSMFFWSTLHNFFPPEKVTITNREAIKASRRFKSLANASKGLIYLTAVSGAFVSALSAGHVYNSFPKVADKFIPDDIVALRPVISNFTENPIMVLFNHRVLGTFTLAFLTGVWVLSRRRILPPRAYKAATALAVMAYLQVAIGITALSTYVPPELAVGHQTGNVLLFSTALWLAHELRKLPK